MSKISVRLDEKLLEQMRVFADKHSLNWSNIIRKHIEKTIKQGEKQNAKNNS